MDDYCLTQLKARANDNSFFVASADLVGPEKTQSYRGASLITGPGGESGFYNYPAMTHMYAGPASHTDEEMLIATLDYETLYLIRTFGMIEGRQPETYKDLLVFLDDSYPNVVCMAFHSLGQRGKKRIVREIVKRIERSDHWYEQWYAYRALRTLGWTQIRSK